MFVHMSVCSRGQLSKDIYYYCGISSMWMLVWILGTGWHWNNNSFKKKSSGTLWSAWVVIAQTVNPIHLFVLRKTSLPSTKRGMRERPLEGSKITFELISPLKMQQENFYLLGLASHHSETFVFCTLVVQTEHRLRCYQVKILFFVWRQSLLFSLFCEPFSLQAFFFPSMNFTFYVFSSIPRAKAIMNST